jgi:hypothetical protein
MAHSMLRASRGLDGRSQGADEHVRERNLWGPRVVVAGAAERAQEATQASVAEGHPAV